MKITVPKISVNQFIRPIWRNHSTFFNQNLLSLAVTLLFGHLLLLLVSLRWLGSFINAWRIWALFTRKSRCLKTLRCTKCHWNILHHFEQSKLILVDRNCSSLKLNLMSLAVIRLCGHFLLVFASLRWLGYKQHLTNLGTFNQQISFFWKDYDVISIT